jgi:hypothetical protein
MNEYEQQTRTRAFNYFLYFVCFLNKIIQRRSNDVTDRKNGVNCEWDSFFSRPRGTICHLPMSTEKGKNILEQ